MPFCKILTNYSILKKLKVILYFIRYLLRFYSIKKKPCISIYLFIHGKYFRFS